ncbi:MAG: peptidoglycan DD-metalloendopeptidase family protein [Granulosicoccus sp.]
MTSKRSGVFRKLLNASSVTVNSKGSRAAQGLGASTPHGKSYRYADMHAGAVRRSVENEEKRPAHLGKLATAAVVVVGAVIWNSGASETFAPFTDLKPETVHAALTSPAFFFDDDADALNRNAAQMLPNSVIHIETSPGDINANAIAIPAAQDIGESLDVSAPGATSTLKADAELVKRAPETALLTDSDDTQPPAFEDAANPTGPERVTVALGDTLSEILNRHGLKTDQMRGLLTNAIVKENLSNIDIGQVFDIVRDDAGKFQSLTTRVGYDRRVNITRTDFGFDVSTEELSIERQRVATSGEIDQSLYLAAEQANLKQSTIMELANIFQWELDFAREIRQGDRFSLVYDRLHREGEYIGDGDILAAEFVRGGKSYKAIRVTTDDGVSGYYSPEGQSMRRTFMRHPVDVVRITSKFDPNRLHPVLHKIRAHRGVDYGSPHGSPIYATADGRVIFSGNKNAYGKTVILKHGDKFSTLYAHMSRISGKSKVGERVNQGDVIGYVGKTGRVTGTHLHYEFRVHGKQIDPLKVELPAAEPIDNKYLGRLEALTQEMSLLMAQSLEESDERVASGPNLGPLTAESQR